MDCFRYSTGDSPFNFSFILLLLYQFVSNYRAITFFDLDGTLLDAKSKITPEVAKAMNALKENNVLPVIATGRTDSLLIFFDIVASDTAILDLNVESVNPQFPFF
ncbi:hypothetical protein EfmGK923_10370 [Enterococcus faecium]|nr:hypothetical protein EfmGK923_10370 [Enterococcus faecium]